MVPASLPRDELDRLSALRALALLDTLPEHRFDSLVQAAARELDAPIAVLSLVDAWRVWFKARTGLDAVEVARELSFCSHGLHGGDALVVQDAQADPRFAQHPLVAGPHRLRFYAGLPLRSSRGQVLGMLCVMDWRPRQLAPAQLDALRALRDVAQSELAISQGAQALQDIACGVARDAEAASVRRRAVLSVPGTPLGPRRPQAQ